MTVPTHSEGPREHSDSPPARSWRRAFSGLVGLVLCSSAGCGFDSDDTLSARNATTTGTGPTSSTTGTPTTGSSSTTAASSSSTGDFVTCEEAIECVFDCITELSVDPMPEPDLSCILECEEGLSVDEALALLRLGNCVSEQCEQAGVCSEDGGTGTGGGSGPIDPCLTCIFANMVDPDPEGCEEFAEICRS